MLSLRNIAREGNEMSLHLRAVLGYLWVVCVLGVTALKSDYTINLRDHAVLQDHYITPNLHLRSLETNSTNANSTNSKLLAAERLIKAAQKEARVRNAYLVAHPRFNTYKFRNFAIVPPIDNATGTGNNATVAKAAVIVTDSLAKNDTTALASSKRQTTTWWMEEIVQNGDSPYVTDTTYKVFR